MDQGRAMLATDGPVQPRPRNSRCAARDSDQQRPASVPGEESGRTATSRSVTPIIARSSGIGRGASVPEFAIGLGAVCAARLVRLSTTLKEVHADHAVFSGDSRGDTT
jgi:hypothetical protein